jgi:tRNA G18 (ribose-2'-O)-methylase SpoU
MTTAHVPGTSRRSRRPRLDAFRNLKTTNATRWAGTFIAEGDKLVRRLLASDFTVEALLVSERYQPQFSSLAPEGADMLVVPDAWIQQLVGFNFHRGILASARRKPPLDLPALCHAAPAKFTLVVCPDVQDPENLGAILRISAAFGVHAVALGAACCDPFSRRVLRVSMGAAFQLPIVQTAQLPAELPAIHEQSGVQSWAAVVDPNAISFDALARPDRLALLLGSEGHGLSVEWLELCQRTVTIPMRPNVDSLNVAVAAGVLLYHLSR